MHPTPHPSKFRRSWDILSQHISKASRSSLIFILFLFFFIATPTLQAISDTNQNGVSDPWEKFFNSGALYTTFTPPTLLTPEAITLTWPTVPGKKYTLVFSPTSPLQTGPRSASPASASAPKWAPASPSPNPTAPPPPLASGVSPSPTSTPTLTP